MTHREIKYMIWKCENSDHSEFDIYAPTKQERDLIEPILRQFESDNITITFKKVYDKIKGFTIKIDK